MKTSESHNLKIPGSRAHGFPHDSASGALSKRVGTAADVTAGSASKIAVVIPALDPVPELSALAAALLDRGAAGVIVVDDGSAPPCRGVFESLRSLPNCTVLTHDRNRGKGRALKTAFARILERHPELQGVVTADADGQHGIDDIFAVARTLASEPGALVLGVRDFTAAGVPMRSVFGNRLTSALFGLLYRRRLGDTQTGLRGIPAEALQWMIRLEGERYDYEITMLIEAARRGLVFTQVPIATRYFDNNAGSHYRIVRDSARIFAHLIAGLGRKP